MNLSISVQPGPEVGLVPTECYEAFKQWIEGTSGQYTLTEVGKDFDPGHDPSRVLGIYQYLEYLPVDMSYYCSINGATKGINVAKWIQIDFRCLRYDPRSAQASAFYVNSLTLSGCTGLPEIPGDRYIRDHGGVQFAQGLGVLDVDNSLGNPLGDFLAGDTTIQSSFDGTLEGCNLVARTQPALTKIAVVTATITAASNPLP